MSLSYIWPIILVVTCNVFYQIFAKGVPKNMDTIPHGTARLFAVMTAMATLP